MERDVDEPDWVEVGAAAERLGVKRETLYAYASRGLLRRRRTADGRRSEYLVADLDALRDRGRRPPATVLPEIQSAVTVIDPQRGPLYRGLPAVELAGTATYEQVATLLWEGHLPDAPGPRFSAAESQLLTARAVVAAATNAAPAARLPLVVTAAGLADPLRRDRSPGAVTAAAAAMLATMVATVGGDGDGPASVAATLTRALRPDADAAVARAVDAALVLLADHELAASTLAARAAASAQGDPYAVVLAGLAVVGGARHGGASTAVEQALAATATGRDPLAALADAAGSDPSPPGFGHPLYDGPDPRGQRLLALLDAEGIGEAGPQQRLLDAARGRGLPPASIDLALAALTVRADLPIGTGELLFAVARTAGWIAHAIEQYAQPALLRPRATPVV